MGHSTGWLDNLKSKLGLTPTKDYTKVSKTSAEAEAERAHFVYLNNDDDVYIESVFAALRAAFGADDAEARETAMVAHQQGKAMVSVVGTKKQAEEMASHANKVAHDHQNANGFGSKIPNGVTIFTAEEGN